MFLFSIGKTDKLLYWEDTCLLPELNGYLRKRGKRGGDVRECRDTFDLVIGFFIHYFIGTLHFPEKLMAR